jgi:hypothetical protein
MASLLEQTTVPTRGVGLTSGVDYFGDVGRRQQVSLPVPQQQQAPLRPPQNVTPAAPSLQVADTRAMNAGFQEPAPEPGFSGGYDFTGSQDVSPNPNLRDAIDTVGLAGSAAAVTGALARDRDLYELGSTLGRGASVAGMIANPSVNTLAPTAMRELGVPAPVAGGLMGAYNDGIPGAIRGATVGAIYSNPATALPAAAWDLGATIYGRAMDVPPNARPTISNTVGQMVTAGSYNTTPFSDQSLALAAQDSGMRGYQANQTTGVSGMPDATAMSYGTNFGSQQNDMLAAQDYDLTYNTPEMMGPMADPGAYGYVSGGGADYDSPVGADAPGTDYSGYSAADMGMADGGMVGDMPGLTKRYNNGGMVSGQPLLSIGYADGGTIGMGSKPTPAIVNKRVDAMLRDPQARQAMLARPQQLMASGELTPDEVTTMARVAEAAMYNPELYPQLRQFVAQQGMTPLPATFDQSVIMRIMAIARALQAETPAGQVPGMDQAQMQRPVPGEGNGGYLQGPGTGRSDSIGTVNETTGEPVKVANGEYVIPAHVVRAKGREFFDNLLRRYSDVPKGE